MNIPVVTQRNKPSLCDTSMHSLPEHPPTKRNKHPKQHPKRNKYQVGHQFTRAAATYDQAAQIQHQALDGLIHRLRQQQPQALRGHWLDIGCGTGKAFTPLQNQGVSQITGIDLSAGMLHQSAQRQTGNIQLIQADADALPIASQSIDGLISSLMLQWSQNTTATLAEWARVLKPGGCAAIATLLPGTHAELQQAWESLDGFIHVNHFDTHQELQQAAHNAGLTILHQEQHALTETHPSLPALLKQLKAIGATNVNPGRRPGLTTRSTLQQLDRHYPRNQQQQLPLTYQVVWIVAIKPIQPNQSAPL